ncbi:MAG: hypothetical protein IJ684_04625 [Bacteroidales bacterium]|nr:hypothetical protein [Bacteroidales bacterium]
MKKALLFVSCAMLIAGMTISCGSKNAEANATEPETCCEATEAPVQTVEAATSEATTATVDNSAMLAAAREAGQAKCNCYKTDAASVEACIRSILSEKYADYQNNDEFKAAMEEEFNACVKEKVQGAAKEAGEKALTEGAKALSNALNKKN